MDRAAPTRRTLLAGGAALAGLSATGQASAASPPGTLTYGISMTDLPLTTGQPDRGAGGYQFTGLTLYDPLVAWELDVSDRPGRMVPGLATAWESDPADRKSWIFKLRDGVSFHDGSKFDADAVVWNFDKVLNKEAPHFDQRQAAQVRPRLPGVASYKTIDPMTVQVTTISPSLAVKDGKSWLAFGSMGGDQQDQWQLQFFLNRVVFDMPLQMAIEAPKFSSEHFPALFHPHDFYLNRLRIETTIDQDVLASLAKRGHDLDLAPPWTEGYLCGTERNPLTGVLEAGSDPRGNKSEVFPAFALAY